jgi:pyruvate/2-oxoglutarate dehydrogenase complex dihydrolipoamide acyltransferase (E2) component
VVQYGAVHLAFAVAIEEGLPHAQDRDAHLKTIPPDRAGGPRAHQEGPRPQAEARLADEREHLHHLEPSGCTGSRTSYGINNPPNGAILNVGAKHQEARRRTPTYKSSWVTA